LPILLISILFLISISQISYPQQTDLENAKILNQEVIRLYQQGRYKEAIPISEKVLTIREKVLGPEHSNTATSLNDLGVLNRAIGAYDKAEPLYRRSLEIYEKALGPEHPNTAAALNNLAALYRDMGAYDKAEPLYRRSLEIYEKALGPEHPNTAAALNNLAELYRTMGAYDKAEPLYRRSLAIYEKAVGPEHSNTAASLNNLAGLYQDMGAYDKAEPLYRRSLAIKEKALGPEHPNTAVSLNNLAEFYRTMGAYDKAEPLYRRSLAIKERALGPEHPDTAVSLNNLAEFYSAMGAYDKAEPLYRRSLAIKEKALGPEHPDTGVSLNNLAELYRTMRAYDKAESLHRRSLTIREKALGPEHPNIAFALNNLAGLYQDMGAYDKAEPLYRRSLAINEKALGPEHPGTAVSLNNLAALYRDMGAYNKAEPLYRRSLATNEKALGAEHPNTAAPLNNLGLLYTSLGQDLEALAFLKRAQGIERKQIDQILGFASEAEQTKFLGKREFALHLYFNLLRQRFPDNPEAQRTGLDFWLFRKGILLEAQKRIQDVLVDRDNPQARELFANLTQVRQELARLVLGGPGKEGPKAYQERIAELTGKKETLEGQLSRLSQSFAQRRKTTGATTADVAAALPSATVLIEFARTRDYDFQKGKWASFRYMAFVLRPGKKDEVSLIDLGEADGIDRRVAAFKKALRDPKRPHETLIRLSTELNQAVFAPLKPAIGGTKRLFLSPDGSLNLIPFEVLRTQEGRYLIEDYAFTYLAAGRDLAGFGMVNDKAGKPLFFGDPDFDLDPKDLVTAKVAGAGAPLSLRSRDMKNLRFERLPATREEVEAIAALLGRYRCELFTGRQALEEVLMSRESPRILHLATHGFFLDDQGLPQTEEGLRGISIVAKDTPAGKKDAIRIENPLLRSGIVLAGANRAMTSEGSTTGIVTAEKILGLRLRGTDLVVLSACETGMGEVKNGEGVYGLRRAFTQAGAKSIVMSLWEVPDRETKELMISFYRNILSGKMLRDEALRQAILRQMETVKGRYGESNPHYWGAFIFLGEAE
jgi:CHAT domain-containing protein/Tfp pilus assembly protein PilF